MEAGDSPSFKWPNTAFLTGVIFQRSELRLINITHGTSNTYLIGEKYLNPDHYSDGLDMSDNENLYVGFDNDNHRFTSRPPKRDRRADSDEWSFGSAHPVGLNMAYCDGSVHFIPYGIDPQVHMQAGNRY